MQAVWQDASVRAWALLCWMKGMTRPLTSAASVKLLLQLTVCLQHHSSHQTQSVGERQRQHLHQRHQRHQRLQSDLGPRACLLQLHMRLYASLVPRRRRTRRHRCSVPAHRVAATPASLQQATTSLLQLVRRLPLPRLLLARRVAVLA